MPDNKPNIIFLGTPELAVPALKALVENNLKPFLVITQPDKPAGRSKRPVPGPVKEFAIKNGIKVVQPADKEELKNIFEKNSCDAAILVAYGMIIPEEVLAMPKHGFLNLHPSLLPKYRGSAPVQAAVLNGDDKTGVSIIKLTKEMDAGPIAAQKTLDISADDNAKILSDKLFKIGAELLIEILPDYLSGKIELKLQDQSKAIFTKLLKREDGHINWSKKALEIKRQFRAFYPWPGLFSQLDGKRLKITNLSVLEGDFGVDLSPGELFLGPKKELAVKAGSGAVILESLQPEGKKEMSGQDFLRGQKDLIGKVLE
ncbi:methionyl-tRNA formyltransferase [Candidatus Falkowbacteria bacterium]|nr:methionyl-tRNA formyltransferase [Candidatus Falkowbacteria bacterium]